MTIGKKIKQLRTEKGATQETLASYLNISFQAVSKWENGTSTPDITLLPKLSQYFGTTIDELFTLNDDAHIERIENMLMTVKTLDVQDEAYAKKYLLSIIGETKKQGKAFELLARLSNHRARSYKEEAKYYAKKALAICPDEKMNHVSLVEAMNGQFTDWNYDNYHDLIAYYEDFVSKHPDFPRGYMYLMDHLIADGRLDEASKYLESFKTVDSTFRTTWYTGRIENKKGNHKKATSLFNSMVESDPDNWLTYAIRADERARLGMYDEAIKDNQKAYELQPSPKYIDAFECMAHIYEINGENKKAKDCWIKAKEVLEAEWDISFGELVDRLDKNIKKF